MPVTASTMRALVITVSTAINDVTTAACPIPSRKTFKDFTVIFQTQIYNYKNIKERLRKN